MVLKCPICLEYSLSNQKEPMIPQPIPTTPWETVATDLFIWNNSNYLLVVDHFSRYFEIAKLPDTKSSTVIHYTKSIFARHGIPREVKSDNTHHTSTESLRKNGISTTQQVHITRKSTDWQNDLYRQSRIF